MNLVDVFVVLYAYARCEQSDKNLYFSGWIRSGCLMNVLFIFLRFGRCRHYHRPLLPTTARVPFSSGDKLQCQGTSFHSLLLAAQSNGSGNPPQSVQTSIKETFAAVF